MIWISVVCALASVLVWASGLPAAAKDPTGAASQMAAQNLVLAYSGFAPERLDSLASQVASPQTPALQMLTAFTSAASPQAVWSASFSGIALPDWQRTLHDRNFQLLTDSTGTILLAAYSYIAKPASAADSTAWKNNESSAIPKPSVSYSLPVQAPAITLAQALSVSSTYSTALADRLEAYYLKCVWVDSRPRFRWLPSDTTYLWLVCKGRYVAPTEAAWGQALPEHWEYDCAVIDALTGTKLTSVTDRPRYDKR